jgi:hypothetical protein
MDPPDLAATTVVTYNRFHGKLIGWFRFSRRGEYIGGRVASARRGQGARTVAWCGRPLVPLRLCFGLRDTPGKIGTLAFISSNSKNILCVAFLKHKNSRNKELALWHLANRLVLENA